MTARESIESLPIYLYLDEIVAKLKRNGSLLLSAEPGAGKTTLVPWKLLQDTGPRGRTLLLEPRRIAARAAADRISALLGEKTGGTAGLRTRLETAVGPRTRLEVVTEGILTRIIQNDPALTGYDTVIFDEFHERSVQGDLGLALAWNCREVFRPDLKVLLMSATLPMEDIRKAYSGFERVSVPGRVHPVEVINRPPLAKEKPWDGAARLAMEAWEKLHASGGGDVLVFLPGFREIYRARDALASNYPGMDAPILLLHGQLPPEEQRKALDRPQGLPGRVILSTNVAESSVTIPGVRAVVDTGLERRVRYSPATGMDHWETIAVSGASAEQRKGRAGRTGPGWCWRWWKETDYRDAFAPPEITIADLAPLVLETALWGAKDPMELKWMTPPSEGTVRQAAGLLRDLELLDDGGRITPMGRKAAGLGIHPRLGRMAIEAEKKGWGVTAAVTAAVLAEGDPLEGAGPDFSQRLEAWNRYAGGNDGDNIAFRRIRESAARILRGMGKQSGAGTLEKERADPALAGILLLLAYPDRAGRRTRDKMTRNIADSHGARYVLSSGRGAVLDGPLSSEEFIAVADIRVPEKRAAGSAAEGVAFLAAGVSRRDIESGAAGELREEWSFAWDGWKPSAKLRVMVGRLALKERSAGLPGPEILRREAMSIIMEKGAACLPFSAAARQFLARCRFVQIWGNKKDWPDFSEETLVKNAGAWLLPYGNYDKGPVLTEGIVQQALENYLGWNRKAQLDKLAPSHWTLPSGSRKALDYETGDAPVLAARLQEFFGCTETPSVCGQPLVLHLLSPAGRPVQVTRDLNGFWDRAYPEVKKELMGRYPRHYWPANPREAEPTARAKKKK